MALWLVSHKEDGMEQSSLKKDRLHCYDVCKNMYISVRYTNLMSMTRQVFRVCGLISVNVNATRKLITGFRYNNAISFLGRGFKRSLQGGSSLQVYHILCLIKKTMDTVVFIVKDMMYA